MDETTVWNKSDMEKNYCFGCLCDSEEKNVQNYAFQCGPLKEIFQVTYFLLTSR